MNNTKKLTTGAMLLAIVGALMLIDRQLSYMFETIIVLAMPVMIIIYSTMYEIKDGAILAVCLLFLTFVLGNPEYAFINVPIAVVVGMGYSFGIKKNFNKTKLMIISMILFVIGEVIVAFIVTPLLGISIAQQVDSIKEIYTEVLNQAQLGTEAFDVLNINFSNLVLIMLVLSTLLLGVMEGFIIHIISLFLLNRFKIKTIDKAGIVSINLHPAVAYVCFLSFASMYFLKYFESENIKLAILTLSMIGSIILFYYGYMFVITYLKLRTGRKQAGLLTIVIIILTMPLSMLILVILGFLYGAGPLKRKLSELGGNNPQ
ncbi:MAG: DUF2232 domain-containing protein [Erysipelotrichaceae bacterium]|nr:DUF2232 domain-containing protein [Erysipelotrichaceae bacterium]